MELSAVCGQPRARSCGLVRPLQPAVLRPRDLQMAWPMPRLDRPKVADLTLARSAREQRFYELAREVRKERSPSRCAMRSLARAFCSSSAACAGSPFRRTPHPLFTPEPSSPCWRFLAISLARSFLSWRGAVKKGAARERECADQAIAQVHASTGASGSDAKASCVDPKTDGREAHPEQDNVPLSPSIPPRTSRIPPPSSVPV